MRAGGGISQVRARTVKCRRQCAIFERRTVADDAVAELAKAALKRERLKPGERGADAQVQLDARLHRIRLPLVRLPQLRHGAV